MQRIKTTEILLESWNKTKDNFWVIVNAVLLSGLIFFVTNLIIQNVPKENVGLNLLACVLSGFIDALMMFLLIKFFIKIYNDQEVSVTGMFSEFKGFYNFFIIYTAINISAITGLILLIIPGLYVIATYVFAPYLCVDKGLGIQDSMQESERITKGNKLELLKFLSWIFIINAFGAVIFLVGLIITIPISFLSAIAVYKKLSEPSISETI